MRKSASRSILASTFLFTLLTSASRLDAQSTFGSIVGEVRDPSGAVVAAAEINVTEIDANTVRSVSSDKDGLYQILNLKPGRYEISAVKSGFATTKAGDVLLEARQTIRINLKLEIAPVAQTVVVTNITPLINTENPTISDTKTFQQITQLPLNYRGVTTSPLIATMTVPGVQHDTYNTPSLGGGLPSQIEYSVDGISTHSSYINGPNYDMVPSTEMISEFRVTSVNNNAEFGQMGDVTVITRSGTNKLHGSALWYHQNAAMDATIYGSPEKQHKVFNTFGGSLSGPIDIPHVYHGKNHTFFFVDFEGNRQPSSFPDQESVPTAAMRAGDLNGVLKEGESVIDPVTGAPFPGNVIPSSRINPVARSLLQNYYPLPNYDTGGSTNANYRTLVPTSFYTGGYDVRIDHVLSSRQQIFGRWGRKGISTLWSNGLLPPDNVNQTNRNLILSHNYFIRPNLINEFRFGFSLFEGRDRFPILGTDAVAILGIQGLDLSNSGGMGGFPYFDFSDGTGFSSVGHGRDSSIPSSRSWQYTDNLSWIHGRHTMKMGGDLRCVSWDGSLSSGYNGEFGYFGFYQGTFSGNAFADLLLGLPTFDNYAIVGPNINERSFQTHLYAQDQWLVNSRFTLSFGLRWTLQPPMTEASGNIANFNPANSDVVVPDHTLPASPSFLASTNSCPGTDTAIPCTHIVTASQARLGQGLRQTYYGNWAPRIGFAWRPFSDGKTVMRSGFGIFTETVQGWTSSYGIGMHTSDSRTFNNYQGPGEPPIYVLPQISSGPLVLPPVGTQTYGSSIDFGYKDPRSYQWSFTVERELARDTVARVSYVGSQSVGLGQLVDLNQQTASTLPFDAKRRPYLAWNLILSLQNLGFASYNGLQAELTHRWSHGLYFQSSYVFSKNIGNAGGFLGGENGGWSFPNDSAGRFITDRFDTRLDRGVLGGSREQRFLLAAIYQLPIGKGQAFAKGMNTVTNAIFGGWEISTITLLESGPFLTPRISSRFDQSNTNAAGRDMATRPDRIGNGNLPNPTPDHWLDITAFTPTPNGAGRFGNSGVGIVNGPGTIAIALGLFKSFSITEKLRLRLEGTFTNLPNHPNFTFIPPRQLFIDRPGFGQITSVQTQENSGNRTGQIGIRLDW